jgi:DNA processing protein
MHLYLAVLHSLGLSQRKLRDIAPERAQSYYDSLDTSRLIESGYSMESAVKIVDKKTSKIVEDVERSLQNTSVIHIDDDEYPSLLKTLVGAPTIIYVRGILHPNDALISVVGSRKHSQYAESCVQKIIPGLIRAGYGIVSGGAYGIDTVAHEATLREKWHTTVVFGSGIDVYYPPSNTAFFEKVIASGGALVSQFPLGTLAEPYNFPMRNDIVAGISRGTLIAEAGEDSGTLITARLALEANRDVFVIPSDITREWALGSNRLIRDWLGKLITSHEDILSEYQIVDKQLSMMTTLKPTFAHPIEESIYDILCLDSLWIDSLTQRLNLDTQTLMIHVSSLEIEGIITSSGGVYRIN